MSELPATRQPQWLDRLLQLALLLCCGMALSKSLADPDFWGHVEYGRHAIRDGLPLEATHTYTATGHRWINHENLAEAAFAVGVDTLGPSALLVLKCLAGMAVLALVLRKATQQGVGQLAAYTGAMLVAGNMMLFWTMRPQLFSFLFFVLLLLLLDWAFANWSPASPDVRRTATRLLPAVPLFVVWTNTHGGFLAGLCVMIAYLGLRWFEARRAGWRLAAVLAGIVLLTSAATLLNPYGWELHRWLLASLGVPRPEIVEWRPPEFTVPWIPFWGLAAVVVGCTLASQRRRDWVQLTIVGLTLWQAVEHRRHVVFLSLLFGFWMLPHWDSLLKRIGIGRDESTIGESLQGLSRRLFGVGMAAATALLCVCLANQCRCMPVRHDDYPVDAFQFMSDRGLGGRLLTRMRWGQYAIAAFGDHRRQPAPSAQMTVAFDGRFRTCYPQEAVDRYFDFADGDASPLRHRSPRSGGPDGRRIIADDPRPDFVLLDRAQANPVRIMSQQPDWTLVYQDPLCQLWCPSDECDDPASPNYIPPDARRTDAQLTAQVTPWPALPARREAAASRPELARGAAVLPPATAADNSRNRLP